jgi:tRNA(fMet)-specific endonuclease VapC
MTVRFLLDSNIISEPSRPIPNTQLPVLPSAMT